MKDYMALWLETLPKRLLTSLATSPDVVSIAITGAFDQYLVYARQFASIKLRLEPAPSFEIVSEISPRDGLYEEYLNYAVFGLLDVLMFAEKVPIARIRFVLESVEFDPIETSPMAFRYAGRDAGRQVVASLEDLSQAKDE